jgi:hypothetical protein
MAPLVPVTVMVPEDRLGQFYEMCGSWLQEVQARAGPLQATAGDDFAGATKEENLRGGTRSWLDGTAQESLEDAA